MTPRWLGLSAFGPYKTVQTIDFAPAEAAGVFLIHGQTGAGKSSLLEAMTYALYGNLETESGSVLHLRSHYAAVEDPTEVIFEFSLGSSLYRIERGLKTIRRKDGSTDFQEQLALCRWNADPAAYQPGTATAEWQAIGGGKKTEIDEHIKSLTGLTALQFRKVIVLPQGQFRDLLLAKSDEKETILATLFGTGRFEAIEKGAKDRVRQIEAAYAAEQDRLANLLASAEVEDLDGLAIRRAELETNLATTQADRSRLLEEAAALATDIKVQTAELARFDERDRLAAELEGFAQAKADHEAQRAGLERDRQLLGIWPLVAIRDQAQNRATQAQTEAAQARSRLEAAQVAAQTAEEVLRLAQDHLVELRQHTATEAPRLDQLRQAALELAKVRQQIQAWRRDEAEWRRTAAIGAGQDAAKDDLTRINLTLPLLRDLHELCSQLDQGWRTANQNQKDQEGLAAEAALVEADRSKAEAEVSAVAAELSRAEEGLQGLVAHQLRASLVEGEPCPVCGSRHHETAPGVVPQGPSANLSELRARWTKASQRLQDLGRRQAELSAQTETKIAALKEWQARGPQMVERIAEVYERLHAGDQATAAGLPVELANLPFQSNEPAFWPSLPATLRQLGQDLQTKRQEATKLLEQGQDLPDTTLVQRELTALETRLADAVRQSGAWEAQLGNQTLSSIETALGQLRDHGAAAEAAVETRRASAVAATQALASAQEGQRNAEQLVAGRTAEAQEAQDRLEGELRQLGFDASLLAKVAPSTAAAIATALQEWEAWDQAYRTTADQHRQLATALADRTRPDLAPLLAAEIAVRAQISSLDQTLGSLESQRDQVLKVESAAGRLAEELANRQTTLQDWRSLANLLNGQNDRKINLQRFALSIYLDEVLAEANQLLFQLTEGRYRLERSDAAVDARRNAGLDLLIADEYTGQSRPVRTLSGGESFLASLSLALGLSTVVQARSGGRKLDALFIDEGFGSLDEEALQSAMTLIGKISAGGRILGIISHVKELQERIGCKLAITKGRNGSSVAWAV